MGRPRNPERDKSLQRYIDSRGEISTAELAGLANVPEARIRKWKSEDRWEEKLKSQPRKKGGQKGNQNAKGKSEKKKGNKNAEKHGIYSSVDLTEITQKEAEMLQGVQEYSTAQKIKEEYNKLLVKAERLQAMLDTITEEEKENPKKVYTDTITKMSGAQEMTVQNASTAFQRKSKIEEQLMKVHRSIIKVLDTMRAHELDTMRLQMDLKRYELQKMRVTGVVEVDDEEEIIDVGDL